MAHAAKLNVLTDDLVQSLTGLDQTENPQDYRKARDIAVKGLRSNLYGRTNQFDIEERLAGLQEKFFVLNREDLADAVNLRLQALDTKDFKWTPETLSLLLELSDQPTANVDLDELEHLKAPELQPLLTWDEIFGEDEEDRDGIWDDVDYAATSSDDEIVYEVEGQRQRERDRKLHVGFEQEAVPVDTYLVAINGAPAENLRRAQFWRSNVQPPSENDSDSGVETEKAGPRSLTELQAVREVLFMLAGLPTSLFRFHNTQHLVQYNGNYVLKHTSHIQLRSLLNEYSAIGSSLLRLRRWADSKQTESLLQTFQNEIETRLTEFDLGLAQIQQKFINPIGGVVVSLQQLLSHTRELSLPFQRLSNTFAQITATASPVPATYLEKLFEATIMAQVIGEDDSYNFLAGVFFACFRTYLKPIRAWIEQGYLSTDTTDFFVAYANSKCDVSELWHERFRLQYDPNGHLHAPSFLRPKTKQIFNTGKSVVFLRELGHNIGTLPAMPEPTLDYQAVCQKPSAIGIQPFANLFASAFEEWILSKHNLAAEMIRSQIFDGHGLLRHLDSLAMILLSKDGIFFQSLADSIFGKLEDNSKAWNDHFVLTDTAQRIFGEFSPVESWRLFIKTSPVRHEGRTVKNLATIMPNYTLPWALLNIIRPSFIEVYQQIFSLLLQCYRAKYVLQRCPTTSYTRRDEQVSRLVIYLRHRLMWFADSIRSYLAMSVLPGHSRSLRERLTAAIDVDAMSEVCTDCSNKLQEQCLLSKNLAPINQAIISILDLAVVVYETLTQNRQESGTVHFNRSRTNRKRYLPDHEGYHSSSSSDEAEAFDDGSDDGYSGDDEEPPVIQDVLGNLERAKEQFDRLCPFVASGLKSIARSRGEKQWQILAERLDWERAGDAG